MASASATPPASQQTGAAAGAGLPVRPLTFGEHLQQYEQQVLGAKESQETLQRSVEALNTELQAVREVLNSSRMPAQAAKLGRMHQRLVAVRTTLSTVEARLKRVQQVAEQR